MTDPGEHDRALPGTLDELDRANAGLYDAQALDDGWRKVGPGVYHKQNWPATIAVVGVAALALGGLAWAVKRD